MRTTDRTESDEYFDIAVIGGGQAGLAVGYHLTRTPRAFCILDASPETGHVWRNRWDSLRLFTPNRNSSLPGRPLPGPAKQYPTKNQVADYLADYADRYHLPIRHGTRVERLTHDGTSYVISVLGQERVIRAARVIVATGTSGHSWIPSFAADIDQSILQMHSNDYRNPGQIQDGPVMVVGAGNSGAEIALELSKHQRTFLAGRGTGTVPRVDPRLDWLLLHRVLNADSPLGRQFYAQRLTRGHPWLRVKESDFAISGIARLGRVDGVRDGLPLVGSDTPKVANVVWATGYRADYSWIDLPGVRGAGVPAHTRGVVSAQEGLYFVGLPFQYSVSSALIGGAGRDAEYVVQHAVGSLRTGRFPAAA